MFIEIAFWWTKKIKAIKGYFDVNEFSLMIIHIYVIDLIFPNEIIYFSKRIINWTYFLVNAFSDIIWCEIERDFFFTINHGIHNKSCTFFIISFSDCENDNIKLYDISGYTCIFYTQTQIQLREKYKNAYGKMGNVGHLKLSIVSTAVISTNFYDFSWIHSKKKKKHSIHCIDQIHKIA